MIVLDTSALMALMLSEPSADDIAEVLAGEAQIVISAGTLAEALIVAARRGIAAELDMLLDGLGVKVEALTAAGSRDVAAAYGAWGKHVHAAGLNLGDCFAYACAQGNGAGLLFVGENFSRTDVVAVLRP